MWVDVCVCGMYIYMCESVKCASDCVCRNTGQRWGREVSEYYITAEAIQLSFFLPCVFMLSFPTPFSLSPLS